MMTRAPHDEALHLCVKRVKEQHQPDDNARFSNTVVIECAIVNDRTLSANKSSVLAG
jgi:hypothetical protein